MIRKFAMICKKCGKPIGIYTKHQREYCIGNYRVDENLCVNCNAVNSVVHKFKDGKEITLEDLKRLPKKLTFDPLDNNPAEHAVGVKFMECVNSFMTGRAN